MTCGSCGSCGSCSSCAISSVAGVPFFASPAPSLTKRLVNRHANSKYACPITLTARRVGSPELHFQLPAEGGVVRLYPDGDLFIHTSCGWPSDESFLKVRGAAMPTHYDAHIVDHDITWRKLQGKPLRTSLTLG